MTQIHATLWRYLVEWDNDDPRLTALHHAFEVANQQIEDGSLMIPMERPSVDDQVCHMTKSSTHV